MSIALVRSDRGVSLFRSEELPGIKIARVLHSGPLSPWQFLPMVQLVLTTSGSALIGFGKNAEVVAPGDVWINGPDDNPRVFERLTPTASTLRVHFSPAVFGSLTGLDADAIEPQVMARSDLGEALVALADAVEHHLPEPAQRSGSQSLGRAIGAGLAAGTGRKLRPVGLRPEVARARRILRERFKDAVSLTELTQLSGLSKFHLLRVFHEELGLPPHNYQLHVRISRGREMLDSGVPAAEVALACGFSDQAHFTRCFKRIVGYTPAAFARMA